MLREFIRTLLYPFAMLNDGNFVVPVGSLRYYLLTWLYGEGEEQHDGWIWPDDKNADE